MTITITTGISTTKKSAQSKKCRLLEKVRNGLNPKIAIAILKADSLLGSVMTETDVLDAVSGLKPKRGGNGGGTIKLEIEV
jgi:hypothetical protein